MVTRHRGRRWVDLPLECFSLIIGPEACHTATIPGVTKISMLPPCLNSHAPLPTLLVWWTRCSVDVTYMSICANHLCICRSQESRLSLTTLDTKFLLSSSKYLWLKSGTVAWMPAHTQSKCASLELCQVHSTFKLLFLHFLWKVCELYEH